MPPMPFALGRDKLAAIRNGGTPMRSIAPALLLALPMLTITGCAADGQDARGTPPVAGKGACDNAKLDGFVGQRATAELGAQMLAASGARTLRWAAPGMALTMDFREDRLTVAYDVEMAIQSARCG